MKKKPKYKNVGNCYIYDSRELPPNQRRNLKSNQAQGKSSQDALNLHRVQRLFQHLR